MGRTTMEYHINGYGEHKLLPISVIVVLIAIAAGVNAEMAGGPILAAFPSAGTDAAGGNCSSKELRPFVHLALDEITGKIYVGGTNRLIQLNSTLKLEACVVTGPRKDSPQCPAGGCNGKTSPGIDTALTDNVNKILLIDVESDMLIACGSLYQGACEKHNLGHIGRQPLFVPIAVAANDEESSTYAFIGPERYNQWGTSNVIYVGTTFTNNGEYRPDVPALASRNIHSLEVAELSLSKQSLLRIDVKYRDHFLVKYVYGFSSGDYAYFVTVQKQSHLPGQEELGYVSRVARVCINDANYDSYTEVTVQCLVVKETADKVVNYNLVQDAKLATAGDDLAVSLGVDSHDSVLVASFSPSRGISNEPMAKSAVCVYSMRAVEEKFNQNIQMCFNGTVKYRNMPYISGLILNGNCPSAGTTGLYNYCEVGLKISGVIPISTEAAAHFPNRLVTAVAVTTTEKNTVAFLGTSNGSLKKVLLNDHREGYEYEELMVDSGNKILPDTTFSPNGEYIYVLTTARVSKVSIEHCISYTNCSACLDVRDPYCGWCSLERRCTIRSACQKASHSSPRWLSLGTGQQCIDFEQVQPDRIPITQMTSVQLSIKTLPELPMGAKYKCVFGGADPIDAGVTLTGLSCPTPPLNLRPKIPAGQDHIYVPLSVRSSETNKDFVSRNFAYYNCSVHVRCADCVKSHWACNWCVYENKCVHNASACQGKSVISGENNPFHLALHGRYACPRFHKPPSLILLPNGASKEIVLEVENLPKPLPGHAGFMCIVEVENARLMIPALVQEGRFVACEKTLYSYVANKAEYEASVTIVWNRIHHVDSTNVTLYKCEILGSHRDHADCSLCITRHAKYHCSWCNNACSYSEICPQPHTPECPKPRIDMIKPLSGPVEGGTYITIEGSNLGLKEEDIKNKIHIGGSPCALIEYQVSVRIVCRTGYSSNKKSAPVVIGNAAGYTESSVFFSYENIVLTGVTPSMGPLSGGTQLAIIGHHLNIGSHTLAFLDELTCHINGTQATSSRITCITTRVPFPRNINTLTLVIDAANRTLANHPFQYKMNPSIAEIKPMTSFASGGRMINVHGTNFETVQKPFMVAYLGNNFHMPINKTECTVLTPTQMECPSPPVNEEFERSSIYYENRRKRRSFGNRSDMQHLTVKIGFIMDNVESVRDLEKHYKDVPSQMMYVDDPKFHRFTQEPKLYKGGAFVIEGENLKLASDESDVLVTIGTVPCNITTLAHSQLVCTPPVKQPSPVDDSDKATTFGLPLVVVRVGRNLRFHIGYVKYDMAAPFSNVVEFVGGATAGVAAVFIMSCCFLLHLRRKRTRAEREYKQIQIQMDTLESNVRMECKQAFAELQTDMTDLSRDIGTSGIPILNNSEYIMKVFFPGVKDHPILTEPKNHLNSPRTNYDAAMLQFEDLINNKHFLLTFIDTLEAQETFTIRDRVNVGSLLMVVFADKMEFATEILRCLLNRLIERNVASNHPHLMLRRTDSVVEKMLTNWLSTCMYGYLRDYAGAPLFLLYKAVKHQVEKGPVDCITNEARYSLSEEKLLKEHVDYTTVTLTILQDQTPEPIQCKALSCDTISQAKEKILDVLFKNTPYSKRLGVREIDLEYKRSTGISRILRDDDFSSKPIDGWRRFNTLGYYGITESAIVSIVSPVPLNPYGQHLPLIDCTYVTESNMSVAIGRPARTTHHWYHIVKPLGGTTSYKAKPGQESRKPGAIPEIYLTRLLSTKGIVQKFVDDFFGVILSVNDPLPKPIKWLFDLLDEAYERYNINDPDVLHAWKSNSLPLRFWVNFIKNPDFIFDINKTVTVDACLSVVAQTFMDSCSASDHVLGKDSPSNKLLFAKDIPHYREIVAKFYSDIQHLPPVTPNELRSTMQCLSVSQAGQFHKVTALKELYIYVSKYSREVLKALDSDPHCNASQLRLNLISVASTLDGEASNFASSFIA